MTSRICEVKLLFMISFVKKQVDKTDTHINTENGKYRQCNKNIFIALISRNEIAFKRKPECVCHSAKPTTATVNLHKCCCKQQINKKTKYEC